MNKSQELLLHYYERNKCIFHLSIKKNKINIKNIEYSILNRHYLEI